MADHLAPEHLDALKKIDTPTICNLLEMVAPARRGHGYTVHHLHCAFPALEPMVGYARTCRIRAKDPAPGGKDYLAVRSDYYTYVGTGPAPRLSVVQDLDEPAGYGSFWGEVNSNVHKALGCLGTITNGCVRDLDMIADGFQLLSGSVAPSHAYVHIVDFGTDVTVHGMAVRSGDLIHADRHGAVVIPHDVARAIPGKLDLMQRKEGVILDAAKSPDFSLERLQDALRRSAEIRS